MNDFLRLARRLPVAAALFAFTCGGPLFASEAAADDIPDTEATPGAEAEEDGEDLYYTLDGMIRPFPDEPFTPPPELLSKAEAGDIEAMVEIGDGFMMRGKGRISLKDSLRWLGRAAEAGDAYAPFRISVYLLAYGEKFGIREWEGRSPDDWVRLSVSRGHPEATLSLGLKYRFGVGGCPLDYVQAAKWLRVSAERDCNATAMWRYGELFDRGLGVPQDAATAIAWYRRAAITGDERNVYRPLRAHGLVDFGVDRKDSPEACELRRRAEAGDAEACYRIGRFYADADAEFESETVPFALRWLVAAARAGHTGAAQKLDSLSRFFLEDADLRLRALEAAAKYGAEPLMARVSLGKELLKRDSEARARGFGILRDIAEHEEGYFAEQAAESVVKLLLSGDIVPADPEAAYAICTRLDRLRGESDWRRALALRILKGEGTPKDTARAYALLCALADEDKDANAAAIAGMMAFSGDGVAPDYAAACRLLTLGADRDPTLYLPLAHLHADGRGTPQNPTLAYDMFSLCILAFGGNLQAMARTERDRLVAAHPELKGRDPDFSAFDIFE